MTKIKQELLQEDTIIAEAKDFIQKPLPYLEIIPRTGVAKKPQEEPVCETSEKPYSSTSDPIPSSETTVSGSNEMSEENKINKYAASLMTSLSEIVSRLEKFEIRISKLEKNNGNTQQADAAESKSNIEQIRDMGKQLEIIVAGLLNTPDYDIARTFHCRSCGSHGTVAIKVRCTNCKHENWLGWW